VNAHPEKSLSSFLQDKDTKAWTGVLSLRGERSAVLKTVVHTFITSKIWDGPDSGPSLSFY
jgi:hypothetical protein